MIKKFTDQIIALNKQNEDVRECVIKFDQDLSLKCNKSQLLTIKGDLTKTFIQKEDIDHVYVKIKDFA